VLLHTLFIMSPKWILRRVETIRFIDERAVHRAISVDFAPPAWAPVIDPGDGNPLRIVPIAGMRRKSLVNFNLRDGESNLPLLSLRQNQTLTSAILRSWAAVQLGLPSSAGLSQPVIDLIGQIVSGHHEEHSTAYRTWEDLRKRATPEGGRNTQGAHQCRRWEAAPADRVPDERAQIITLAANNEFHVLLDQLSRQFLLFVALPESRTQRTIVKYSYDEALTVRYREPGYIRAENEDARYDQLPQQVPRWNRHQLLASAGLQRTLIRFPVPSAETCASFHLELHAPPGVMISEASILAGRPNEPTPTDPPAPEDSPGDHTVYDIRDGGGAQRGGTEDPFGGMSVDLVRGGFPNVDLHATDVKHGSLCRAQLELSVVASGWLSSTAAITLLITLVVAGVAAWAGSKTGRRAPQDIQEAVATLMVTFAVGAIVFFAQPNSHRMVAKLLSVVRSCALVCSVIALAAGMVVAFGLPRVEVPILWALVVVASPVTLIVALAWSFAGVAQIRERSREEITSPWEQIPGAKRDQMRPGADRKGKETWFEAWQRKYRFDTPAIRVASAEGTRCDFPWSERFYRRYLSSIEKAAANLPHDAPKL
jgi:hypothetical protein